VLQDREERRLERAGLIEPSFWDRLGRSGRIIAIVAAVLVLGAAAAFAATSLLGSDSGDSGKGNQGAAKSQALKPAQIKAAVLNGTGGTEVGLANEYAEALNKDGFKTGVVTDATDTFTESVVMFEPGHRPEAKKVGKAVGIDNFEAMDEDVASLSSHAKVTVVIGTDHGPLPGQ
jgi:hypothetical protein